MDMLTKIFGLIFTPTAIVAGVVYILRKYFDNHVAKELELFKHDLQSQSETARIQFQTNLEARLFEFQTKFSLYHQKQAEIVAELYGHLMNVMAETALLTNPAGFSTEISLKTRKDNAATLYTNLFTFYTRHRIYFSGELDQKIFSVISLMGDALREFDKAHRVGMGGGSEYMPDDTGGWEHAWTKISQETPPVMREVEDYFRSILEGKYDDSITHSQSKQS